MPYERRGNLDTPARTNIDRKTVTLVERAVVARELIKAVTDKQTRKDLTKFVQDQDDDAASRRRRKKMVRYIRSTARRLYLHIEGSGDVRNDRQVFQYSPKPVETPRLDELIAFYGAHTAALEDIEVRTRRIDLASPEELGPFAHLIGEDLTLPRDILDELEVIQMVRSRPPIERVMGAA